MSVETNQPPALAVVDSLAVEVITDNVSDTYVSKTRSPCRNSPISCWPAPTRFPARRCWPPISATGCACARASAKSEHSLLFDTGTEGAIFIRNCRNLGLDLGEVEEIAITHGHWDHMGALPAAIDAIVQRRGRGAVTVHVNPDMFNERGVLLKSGAIFPAAKVPTPAQMEERGARVVNDGTERLLLDGQFYYSGEIPRVTRSRRAARTISAGRTTRRTWRPDPFLMDERMLVAHVRDLGLVVFSACSPCRHRQCLHRGAATVPGHADPRVMGGLHLGGVMEHLIPQTVEALGPFDITIHHHRPLHRLARIARAGQRLSASGSASRRSAPATCSTQRTAAAA